MSFQEDDEEDYEYDLIEKANSKLKDYIIVMVKDVCGNCWDLEIYKKQTIKELEERIFSLLNIDEENRKAIYFT